tara:strand:+ start:450 stop:1088 length:639 start_codon:yes stop_codon:yes gene_type:complete
MFLLIQLFTFIHYVTADIPPQKVFMYTNENNIVAASLWAMGVCSCTSLLCKYKKKLPINLKPLTPLEDEEEHTYYYIKPKSDQSIVKLKEDIDELKNIIDQYYIEEKEIIEEKEQKNIIPHYIRFMFGQGEIKYKKDDKYYHGTDMHNMKRWIKGDGALHRFFERTDGKEVKWDLGTGEHTQYCKDCSYDDENSKRRTVFKVYKCNGHILNK